MKKKRQSKAEKLKGLENFLNSKAKENRAKLGKWELILKKYLSDLGYRFQMQVPFIHKMNGYIVDFLLTDYPLFLEADGKWHNTPEQRKKDNKRSRHLAKEGIFPLRFSNRQITTLTKEQIGEIIKIRISQLPVK